MQLATLLKAIIRTVFVIINNIYSIPAFLTWTIFILPLKYARPSCYWFIEGHLFNWLLYMVSNWMWTAGYKVVEVGDDVTPYLNDECLVVCNHQSTGDVPVLMNCMSNKPGVHNNIMWIMDSLFKYTNFGVVSQIHQDFFITQGKDTREQQLKDLKKHLSSVYQKKNSKWLVLFPEGGFLRKRRETSKRYAKKNGFPILHHVTLPRIGAMEVIFNTLGHLQCKKQNGFTTISDLKHSSVPHSKLKWVIDVTIGYPDGKPLDAFCILFGHRPPCKTTILYRIYPIEDIPHEANELQAWLFKKWEEKEQLLDEFYKSGQFPSLLQYETSDALKKKECIQNETSDVFKKEEHIQNGNSVHFRKEERIVQLSPFKMFFYHLFYIVSTCVQYYAFKNMLGILGFI